MSTDISIRVPKEMATPAEFAEWEGISRGSVYQKIHHGQLAKEVAIKWSAAPDMTPQTVLYRRPVA
ncbi:hypothetical protein, partial [Klebsiella pneumoniae]|uniref:hypothetical protein n=1 Tax=Klebsiella pneumoniae TaxID=573 RepID=UPI00313D2BF0